MTIHRLDEDTVVVARPDVADVAVDDAAVLFDPVRGRTHRLGPVGTAVWRSLGRPSSAVELGGSPEDVASILRQIRRLASNGLLAGSGDVEWPPTPDTVELGSGQIVELVPPEDCARNNRSGWAGSLAVVSGRYALGVRCNDAGLLDALVRVLAPARVQVDDPPPNFSVTQAASGRTGAPHRVKAGCRTLVRSESLPRVLAALRSFVSAHEQIGLADRVLIEAVAVVGGDDAAVLVPERLRPRLGGAGAELARRGWSIVDGLPALAGGEVLVAPATLPVDDAALAAVRGVATVPDPVAPPGRYRLAGWAWPGRSGRGPAPADVVAAVNHVVRNREAVGAAAALRAVAAAVQGTGCVDVPVGPVGTEAVLDALGPLW